MVEKIKVWFLSVHFGHVNSPCFLSTISSSFTAVSGDLNNSGDSGFLLSAGEDVLTAFQKQNQFISLCIWQQTLTGAVAYDFYLMVTPALVKRITLPARCQY